MADAGVSGDVWDADEPDGAIPGDLLLWLSADRDVISTGDTLEIIARVTRGDDPENDEMAVFFQVLEGNAFLDFDGAAMTEISTVGGEARTTLLAAGPGTVLLQASIEEATGPMETPITAQIDITITDTWVDPTLRLDPDLPANLVFAAGSRMLPVVATVTGSDGGPADAVPVTFSAQVGEWASQTDGERYLLEVEIDARDGVATAYFEPGAARGLITLEARVAEADVGSALTAEVTIEVIDLATFTFLDIDPIPLGIEGTGFNPSAVFQFQLNDRAGAPITGQAVTLTVDAAIDAWLEEDSLLTDARGIIEGRIYAGGLAGPFAIVARSWFDDIEVSGQSTDRLWVVTTLPVNRASTLSCSPANLGGLVDGATDGLPNPVTAHCTGQLMDRITEPIQLPTTVYLEAEVGSVPAEVTSDGLGGFSFDWVIAEMPWDVDPMATAMDPEAGFATESGVANLRDGIARVIFWTEGEEYFEDGNGNGERDGGEPFWDQGDPFVDADDSGIREDGEAWVPREGSGLDSYQAGDESWDDEAMIWGGAMVLLSGNPSIEAAPEGSDRPTYSHWRVAGEPVAAGGTAVLADGRNLTVDLIVADERGAPINSSGNVRLSLATCGDSVVLDSSRELALDDTMGLQQASLRTPIAFGWASRDVIIGFELGNELEVTLDNPDGGAPVICELVAEIEYALCPDCGAGGQSGGPTPGTSDLVEMTLVLEVE